MLSSLFYLLAAFIPVLFYIGIIWATTPVKSINLKTAFLYFFTGLISVGIILTYFQLFPNCQTPVFQDNEGLSIFILYFLQVALVEELCKFGAYSIAERIRDDEKYYDSPIGVMFYTGISALGFAFLENVNYAMMYGGQILIIRSVLSMVIHFLCGLIAGYWFSLSRIPIKIQNRSLFEIVLHQNPLLRRIVYYTLGILCAVTFHGFFDYSLAKGGGDSMAYVILFGGAMFAYLAAKNLMERIRF